MHEKFTTRSARARLSVKAVDGEEGLLLAKRERPDLILCDLQMPKLDGFELAQQIRLDPQLSDVPLVAVTASAMPDDLGKVMDAGFNGYITKPIVPEDFVSQAEEFLRVELRSGSIRPPRGQSGGQTT